MQIVIPVPLGTSYQAAARGRVTKLVSCEGCATEYAYLMERCGTGDALSPLDLWDSAAASRATAVARKALADQLMRGVDLVPCPGCGRIQRDMVLLARHLHRGGLEAGAAVAFLVAAILFAAAGVATANAGPGGNQLAVALWCSTGLSALLIPGFLLTRSWLSRRYDPNTQDVNDRIRAGRRLACTDAEFLRSAREAEGTVRQELLALALFGVPLPAGAPGSPDHDPPSNPS